MSLLDLTDEVDCCIHLANALHMMAAYLPKAEGSSVSELAYVIEQKLTVISGGLGILILENAS